MSIWIRDRDRWFLWAPVLVGLGVHMYFLETIVDVPVITFILLCGLGLVFVLRKTLWAYFGIGVLVWGLGISAAAFKTYRVGSNYTPLKTEVGGKIKAKIQDIEVMEGQVRMLLENIQLKDRFFHRVRVNFKHKKNQLDTLLMEHLRPGKQIEAYIRLFPVPVQETPLNYDFQFWAFFQGIEAVGFGSMASIRMRETDENTGWFDELRYLITQQIRNQQLGQVGEIIIALITGYKNGIQSSIRDDFAGSGIAHILAISGLHLSLIAGLMFLLFRRGLGLVAHIALHWPLKKIAAVLALLCSFFYLKISGESIPTIRAFVMISLIMGGIILDRDPISLRSVAWAAIIVLGLKPESLYSPSFQMSFAAVIGLIGTYEYFRSESWKLYAAGNLTWYKKIIVYLASATSSSLIASLATLPFIIHTFHRYSWHSIEANLIAIPLMSFWIMPLAILVLICMPFGLEWIPLIPMGWGVDILMLIAETINKWPGSFVPVGVRNDWFMELILVGSFWSLIWTHRWRWLGLPLVLIAFFLPKKDIFMMVSHDHKRIGIMAGESILLTSTGRPNFVSQDWKGIVGLYDLGKLSKTDSPWVTKTEWGWVIRPFVEDVGFHVAVVVDRIPLLPSAADVTVVGFPKVESIILKNGEELKGGAALWRDKSGQIGTIQEKKLSAPWR